MTTTNDISNDYIITNFSSSLARDDYLTSTTTAGTGKVITFSGDPGLSNFGSSYSTVLRISDGSTTVDYSTEDPGGLYTTSPSATKLAVGSGRTVAQFSAELAAKINVSSSLNVSASAGSNTVTIIPDAGATLTITEDPANNNSGNFGATADYTIISDQSSTTVNTRIAPFRFLSSGAFNLRKQNTSNPYRTFLGKQKI